MVHEQKDKNALQIGYRHFKRSPNSSIFVVKYQSFTKFSIRWWSATTRLSYRTASEGKWTLDWSMEEVVG